MRVPVLCECGAYMESQRISLGRNRFRFTLSCTECWETPVVETYERTLLEAMYGGELVPIGYESTPSEQVSRETVVPAFAAAGKD